VDFSEPHGMNCELFSALNLSKTNNLDFSSTRIKLRDWYFIHQRDLPWRKTKDAYKIWLSEIILQQTRVDQGMPYYQRFVDSYPKVEMLANAAEDDILKLWEGLGYYSRARNLHAAAKMIVSDFKGSFPSNYVDLKKLKGVGDYTAAAVASFAYDEAKAVVDGNVYRFLSRLMAEDLPINSGLGKKRFQEIADQFLDQDDPATHNQAIMEFGALQCVAKSPKCEICPLKEDCAAYARGRVSELPVKLKKKYNQVRYFNYLFLQHQGFTAVEKRTEGIWKSLFQFPLIESTEEYNWDQIKSGDPDVWRSSFTEATEYRLEMHKLSHQSLYITVWVIPLDEGSDIWQGVLEGSLVVRKIDDLVDMAFPRPLRKFLDENQLTLPFE
jgi:A/G-specific adenine glycosylase